MSVKGAKHRRSLLALDGRSGMDQASLSEWRSEALGKIPLPFVVRSESFAADRLRRSYRRSCRAHEARLLGEAKPSLVLIVLPTE